MDCKVRPKSDELQNRNLAKDPSPVSWRGRLGQSIQTEEKYLRQCQPTEAGLRASGRKEGGGLGVGCHQKRLAHESTGWVKQIALPCVAGPHLLTTWITQKGRRKENSLSLSDCLNWTAISSCSLAGTHAKGSLGSWALRITRSTPAPLLGLQLTDSRHWDLSPHSHMSQFFTSNLPWETITQKDTLHPSVHCSNVHGYYA